MYVLIAMIIGATLAAIYLAVAPEASHFELAAIFIGGMIASFVDDAARALRDIAKRGLR